jgi:hypothetical protein
MLVTGNALQQVHARIQPTSGARLWACQHRLVIASPLCEQVVSLALEDGDQLEGRCE